MTRFLSCSIAVVLLSAAGTRAEAINVPSDVLDAYPPRTLALPSNARVAFFGVDVPGISFVRTLADGSELVLEHEQIASANEGIYLVPPGALTAGEPLVISSRCSSGCRFSASWGVGEVTDDTGPVIGDDAVTTSVLPLRTFGGLFVESYRVNIVLPSIVDEAGPALVLIEGDGVAAHVVADGTEQVALLSTGGDQRTECYRVRALDAAGNETVRTDEVCVDLDPSPGEGCAQSSAAWPLALVSLVALRRRSVRSAMLLALPEVSPH